MTLRLLWLEYHQVHPDGYRYSRFCQLYRAWAGSKRVVMRFEHKAGEKIFVDFAGPTMEIIDPLTGVVSKAQVFVAAIGASSYTFAHAVPGQDIASWLSCQVRAFRYFGGVSAILVPDNLKAGVSKACRYDPDVNPAYQELAEHYGVAVIPARAGKPRDKAKAEVAVQNVEIWVLAPLRDRRFFSFEELNAAMAEKLAELNDRVMREYGKSRRELFDLWDRPELKPLLPTDYELATWKKVRVNLDYLIEVDRHYYSVPYTLAHKTVDVRFTGNMVEVFPRERACGLASKEPRSAQAKGAACAHALGAPVGGEVLGRQDKGLGQKHQAVRRGRDQRHHRSPPNSRTTEHRVGIMAAHEILSFLKKCLVLDNHGAPRRGAPVGHETAT